MATAIVFGITVYLFPSNTAGSFYGNLGIVDDNSAVEEQPYLILGQAYMMPTISFPVRKIYQGWWNYGPTDKLVLPDDTDPRTAGQCVIYVNHVTGKYYSGNAEDWVQYGDSDTPQIGSIVVLNAGYWGHVGVVIGITENTITVRSRNYRGLWIVSDDVFDINSEIIITYIDP